MKEKEEKMHFPKIDDFFTTQEERDEQKLEKVEKIAVSSISNFPNHPYQVKDNEEMEDFVENVKSALAAVDCDMGAFRSWQKMYDKLKKKKSEPGS